jgi:predicted membrane protein|tara:strand:- start:353 stop:802 length:450 start_codon:yes stop_codon:yes gene_type:complete
MKLPSILGKQTPLEMVVMLLFVVYLVFPVETPKSFAYCVDSSFGLLTIFLLGLYLFKYSSNLMGVLFIFVAYELINRSCKETKKVDIVRLPVNEKVKQAKMEKMQPRDDMTLEEEVVNKMAPIGKSDLRTYLTSSYNPIASNTTGASLV